MTTIEQRDALGVLNKARLIEIAAALGIGLPNRRSRSVIVDSIASSTQAPLPRILDLLKRDELQAICRAGGIDDSERAKVTLANRILGRGPVSGTDKLTKVELVEQLAADGFTKQDAEVVVNTVVTAMIESLRSGSPIELRGFGSFRFRDRAARTGRNPKTGTSVQIPPKRVCYFRPSKLLLESVNPSHAEVSC